MLALAAVAAVGAVAARDAVYWEKPLPGVAVRELRLDRPVAGDVRGKTVRLPSLADSLAVDRTASEQAKIDAGRDSFRTRVRALVDPSPQRIWVNPVLRPTGAEELVARLERELDRPRPARVERRGEAFVAVSAQPGAEIDRAALL